MSDARTQGDAQRLVTLGLIAVGLIVASSFLGPTRLTVGDVFDAELASAYWTFRVPRTILGACAGAGLALGGVIFQALFRNPLATPYTLGIASGASLGAAWAFLLGWQVAWLGLPPVAAPALGGALLAMGVVLLVARTRQGREMTRLLLAGVCVAYLSASGILLLTYLAEVAVTNDIVIWMMGSLTLHDPWAGGRVAAVLAPATALAIWSHRSFDLLALGDDLAASRGVNVGRTVLAAFVLVGLLTAVIVAHCGPIGFVGLMTPHMVRRLVGQRSLPLMIGSALVGAAFLTVCDGLARGFTAYELPVGIVTNMLGAVFFFSLLLAREPRA